MLAHNFASGFRLRLTSSFATLSVSGPPTGQETERCQSECREWREQSYGTGPDFNEPRSRIDPVGGGRCRAVGL